MELRHQHLTRYISPLREGGSLPALAEADDGFKYAVKFRGAGHGVKALIAELIGGEIARKLGMKVPEIVFLDVDSRFGITEPDVEIQDLLKASRGVNLGLHYLSGSMTLDPYINPVDSRLASEIVWLDSYLINIDRTAANTNMLLWHGREVWLIDHGASLYFHHSWRDIEKAALTPFSLIARHSLLHKAGNLDEVNAEFSRKLTEKDISDIVDLIPDDWLEWGGETDMTAAGIRDVYKYFLNERLRNSSVFTKAAIDERRKSLI